MKFAAADPRPLNLDDHFVIACNDVGNVLNFNDPGGGKYQCLHAILHNAFLEMF
jgi:hypothetical protein